MPDGALRLRSTAFDERFALGLNPPADAPKGRSSSPNRAVFKSRLPGRSQRRSLEGTLLKALRAAPILLLLFRKHFYMLFSSKLHCIILDMLDRIDIPFFYKMNFK